MNKSDDEIRYCNLLNKITPVIWHTNVKLIIDDHEIEVVVLVDTGADLNCIQEGLIPTKYFEKSTEKLNSANCSKMHIKYEINNAHVFKDKVCFKTSFVLVKNMNDKVILGLPFIHLLLPSQQMWMVLQLLLLDSLLNSTFSIELRKMMLKC